jgi:RNA-directed DNA polymerase
MLKKDKLRFNEYYNMQNIFDELYHQSKNGNNFYKLMEIINLEQNIRLAFRNIRFNKGSKTAGVDKLNIKDLKNIDDKTLIEEVKKRLSNYKPQAVKRVFIEKEGSDKKRPLGIPTIWDRIVQQCILQVLEPICEPKFHNHSYGFRGNRSTHHALSRVVSLINLGRHYYCVDIDIKGFFDNVNHGKLLKQIWTLGIRDKRLISIISKLLKAEIIGEGIPTKGTPQGGILSPLLSSIVLNELDWWVSDQWETYKPRNFNSKKSKFYDYARKYTKLKDGFIVRYCDDFKIMCRNYKDAQRYYNAVVDFLKVRLKLEISPEKSKVVNLKTNSSDFLGFKIKVIVKASSKYGYVAKTDICKKAIRRIKHNLKSKIKKIQGYPNVDSIKDYNVTIFGIQNYYRYATNVYKNLHRINYNLLATMKVRLRRRAKIKKFIEISSEFKKKTKGIRKYTRIYTITNYPIIPVSCIHHKNPRNFSQDTSDYTANGRKKIHDFLPDEVKDGLKYLNDNLNQSNYTEFNDNFLSKYSAQRGKCYITKKFIANDKIICHRKIPLNSNGNNEYNNLVILNRDVYELLYETNNETIEQLIKVHNIRKNMMDKINKLRNFANLSEITYKFA